MNGLLIFDKLNDLIFVKYNRDFHEYIRQVAINQELISQEDPETAFNNNVLIQIFSPIVTSHRIMHYQFTNSYTSIHFQDDLKINFSEFMGYLFIWISKENVTGFVQKCVVFARYICGPDIHQLQNDEHKRNFYDQIIDKWLELRSSNQTILVEAIEQLFINSEITSACLRALKESLSKLSNHTECSKVHALLLVDDKVLSLYSSVNAKQLSPVDLLFLIIQTRCKDVSNDLTSRQILLAGSEDEPKCLPHIIHTASLFENVFLIYVFEIGYPGLSAALYENFCHLHALQYIQVQREKENIQIAFENLEIANRKLTENMKKIKNQTLEASYKQVMKQWEVIKDKYKEYFNNNLNETLLRAETLLEGLLDILKSMFMLTSNDDSALRNTANHTAQTLPKVKSDLEVFTDFFHVKGTKNFSLGSYMEDFPGLVHFLYIDRNTHRITTPTLDLNSEKADFMKKKIWTMINFIHTHLQQGYTNIIWKDKTFTYSYFLWFENESGGAIKNTPHLGSVNQTPGILETDYYLKLRKVYFSKTSPSKIRCYELYCVHLGLTTHSSLLEQARRLAGTVWELRGFPTHAIDFL